MKEDFQHQVQLFSMYASVAITFVMVFLIDEFKCRKDGKAPLTDQLVAFINGAGVSMGVWFFGQWSFMHLGAITYVFQIVIVGVIVAIFFKQRTA